jgi:hypothetical protein
MPQDIDNLFVQKYDADQVLKLCISNREKGFDYLSNGVLSWIANLYIADDEEQLEAIEIIELKNISKTQLETLLLNFQSTIEKFFEVQRTKNGVGLYFKFYDNILYKTPVSFDVITSDESINHPIFNKIFIVSSYVFQFLLGHYYSELDQLKRIITYLKQQSEVGSNSPLETFILKTRLIKFQKDMTQMIETVRHKIDSYVPFLRCFLDNIECCLNRNNPQDIEYLKQYPDNIFGIIQNICRLPKNDIISTVINYSINKLYLCPIIPNSIRFDIFNCITNNNSINDLLRDIIQQEVIHIVMDDCFELYKLGACNINDHTSNYVGTLSVIHNYLKKIKKNGNFHPFTTYINNNIEKVRSIIVSIFEYINKCVAEIYKPDCQYSTEMIDAITSEIHYFLTIIKYFIKHDLNIVNCHLVHYIPYVIINIWNSYKDYLDIIITGRFAKILNNCSVNPDFVNYFSNLICDNFTQYDKLIYFDNSKIQKKLDLFNKLSNITTEFIDPIQSIFILKVGYLPMTGSEPILCDKYVIESALRTNPFHPYTREQLSIDDFNKIQIEMNDLIELKEKERKQFVLENK